MSSTTNIDIICCSNYNGSPDIRYIIIDTDTGEVVDDAQGYGYKTKQKAYAAWKYKNPHDQGTVEPAKHNIDVIRGEYFGIGGGERYIVIDIDTNEVLDNANGFGYKSKRNAYAAWYYKCKNS